MKPLRMWVLRGGEPMLTEDLEEAGRFMASDEKFVRRTIIKHEAAEGGEILVSTVFLALRESPPIPGLEHLDFKWETMVFNWPADYNQTRYATKEDALLGHELIAYAVHLELQILESKAQDMLSKFKVNEGKKDE